MLSLDFQKVIYIFNMLRQFFVKKVFGIHSLVIVKSQILFCAEMTLVG